MIDVDQLCPITPELCELGRRRTDVIVKSFGRLLSIWGTGGLHGTDGERIEQVPSIADVASACYVQGVRDAAAVAAVTAEGSAR